MDAPGRPEDALGRTLPDLALPGPDGTLVRLRAEVERGPLVLFFYIRNGTPG